MSSKACTPPALASADLDLVHAGQPLVAEGCGTLAPSPVETKPVVLRIA